MEPARVEIDLTGDIEGFFELVPDIDKFEDRSASSKAIACSVMVITNTALSIDGFSRARGLEKEFSCTRFSIMIAIRRYVG